nr:hypothetical protein [uncultured Albidiferax sp.]
MLKRIKNWVGRATSLGHSHADLDAFSGWADSQGLAFDRLDDAGGFAVIGAVGGRPWRLERSPAGRDFIVGAELRARAELGLPEHLAIMLINRPLKESLEKRAYEQATHGVQTTVDVALPEEARWLALYDQVGWNTAPLEFWDHYALVADNRAQAQQWLDGPLMDLLQAWPTSAVQQDTPFILQVQRGRVYLRMEYPHSDVPTLRHAVAVFTQACVSAQLLDNG